MSITIILPPLVASVLSVAGHVCPLAPAAGGAWTADGLSSIYWGVKAQAYMGSVAQAEPHDYLTGSWSSEPLTDSSGAPLWSTAPPAPAHDYLTSSWGAEPLTDSSGAPLWATTPSAPEHDYLTTTSGAVLTDSAGSPIWI